MAGTTTASVPTTPPGSDVADLVVQFNKVIDDIAAILAASTGDGNVTIVTPTIGTTVTVAVPASVIQINGVPTLLAALTAQAFGSLGTIPQNMYGAIALERVAAGTCTFVSASANYTTGYATDALARAALAAQTADRVRVGIVVISPSHASGWVAGTDALQGGTGGNPAAYTAYYPGVGLYDPALFLAAKIGNRAGTART